MRIFLNSFCLTQVQLREAVVFKTRLLSNSCLRDFDVGVGLSCLGFAWVSAERVFSQTAVLEFLLTLLPLVVVQFC